MLPELEVKVPLPDEYIKSIIRHIVFNDGHFYKQPSTTEKPENMYRFNYFSIASKLRETELNISYNKIKNFLEEITKEYINKELKRELTQEDRGRNEMIEKFKKKPDPLKMITDFFDGTEYNDLEDTIDSLNEIGDEIDVELLDDDKKSDIKDQLGDDVDDLILAIIQNLDTFEENIELGLNQWLFIKYILFRIKNSFIYRLRNLGLKTEDIGITGLDEIKIDDLEVIQFLEEITDKNIDIDTDIDKKIFKITGKRNDEQTKIKPLNINELLTTIQKIRNIEANSAKWNQNTRFIDYVDDILPYLYSQDRFSSILRLKTKVLSVKGGSGMQVLNYLNPTNVLFGNSTVERELDRRDSLCMNDNDKFKIELAMNTSAKKQNEIPHKFYYGTLFKENDENKRKFLIGPGDILVDIHDNNPSKRNKTLEDDNKLNDLIYEKFNLVDENNIRLFTYGKSGSGKTYSIQKILSKDDGADKKMHYYDFSEKKFKPSQKWGWDAQEPPNRKQEDVEESDLDIDNLSYHLYLNQFVTENNSQSSRKHICLSYNNNGKKYNIIDLCGAERPFSIEKYIKKLDDPLYIEANKPEEEAKKVENFKRLLNEFNDKLWDRNMEGEEATHLRGVVLPGDVRASTYFKKLKLWQEDFIKYIHIENDDNYYKTDIIKEILKPDKSLRQILTTNYRSLIDDEEIEELKKIMDNEELSTENKLAALINSFGENDSFQNDVAYIINRIEYLIYTYAKDSSIIADDILCIKRDGPGRYLSEQKLGNKSFSKKLDSIKIKYFNKPEVELLLEKIRENIENYIKAQKINATDATIAELFMEIYNKRIQETEYINRSLDEFSIALTSEKIKKKQKIEKISDLFDINTVEYFKKPENREEFLRLYKKHIETITDESIIIRLITDKGNVKNIYIKELLNDEDSLPVPFEYKNVLVAPLQPMNSLNDVAPNDDLIMLEKLYINILKAIFKKDSAQLDDPIGNMNIVGAQIDYETFPCLKKIIMVKTNIVPMLPEQSRNNPELFLEFLKMHCHYTDNNDYTKSSLLDLKDIEPKFKNESYINMLFGVIDTNKLTQLPQHEIDSLNKFHKEKIVWYIRLILDDDTVNSKHIDELDSLKNLFKLIDPESYKLYEEYVKGQLPPKQDFYGNDLETIYLTNVHSNIAISGDKLALEPIKFTEVSNRNNNAFYVSGGNITKMDKINLELKNIKKLYKALK